MLYARSIGIWFLFLIFAVANGGLRERALLPWLGEPWAHLASGILLIGGILLISALLVSRLHAGSCSRLLLIGALWLVLTVAFECLMAMLRGASPQDMLDAYRFRDGNLWPLVLLFVFLAPLMFGGRRGER
jgi:hypothetical protein